MLVGEVNLNGMRAVLVLLAYFGKSSQHTHSQLGGSGNTLSRYMSDTYVALYVLHACTCLRAKINKNDPNVY